jgi:Zn-dependent M28 family amino/carboxypeptidase
MNASEKEILLRNLRRHVAHLSVNIGERHLWNGDSLEQAAQYIESEFSAAGYVPMRQTYLAYRKPVSNIITEKKGTRPHSIVIGAHYDSVPGSPGADDNASAVAGLLELARMLRNVSCASRFRLVAFVNEESPSFGSDYMGSMQYARLLKARGEDVAFMIALEMIGYFDQRKSQHYPLGLMRRFYPQTGDFIVVIGDLHSQQLARALARTIRRQGLVRAAALVAPRFFGGIDRSDHSAFWRHGFKAIMVTDTAMFRNENYHRETDTIETINFEVMADVVASLFAAVVHLGGCYPPAPHSSPCLRLRR